MENAQTTPKPQHQFSEREREALYRTIYSRRDVRGQFTDEPISAQMLSRVLMAAHYAPSVGFMQPWSFILIRALETKKKVHALFTKAHGEAAQMFAEKYGSAKRETYKNLKLEGILEAPLNLCITCDKDRAGPVVLGRTHIPEMDLYSTVCAVQNLWLAARAEGLGMGWVSILDQDRLKDVLGLPQNVVPVAYLCLGHVSEFSDKPELQKAGWRRRLPIETLTHFEGFEQSSEDAFASELFKHLRQEQKCIEEGRFDAAAEG